MLYGITQNPLFDIDEKDADNITLRAANVARHYENIPGVSQKTRDWILFIQCLGAVYVPRFAAWRMEVASRQPKPARPQSPLAPQNVAPSPSAANRAPQEKVAPSQQSPLPRNQPMPTADDATQLPQTPGTQPPAPPPSVQPRHNPALDAVDGSGRPLKFN
jgi:hypothetical protein